MRLSWAIPRSTKLWFLLAGAVIQPIFSSPVAAEISAETGGLSMVPLECWTATREKVPVDHLLVLHNKVITFDLSNPYVVVGLFFGGLLPFLFGGMSMTAVGRAAESTLIHIGRSLERASAEREQVQQPRANSDREGHHVQHDRGQRRIRFRRRHACQPETAGATR